MSHRYYSPLRPLSLGTFPKPQGNEILHIENFEERQNVPEIARQAWGYIEYKEALKVFPLDDSGNYAELASYLIKYTGTHKKGTDGALQGKRWNCSKNLVRPEPEYHIISDREYFKKEPKAIKGYYVDKNSVSMGVHSPEYYGYGYLRYTLVKITDRGGLKCR